jgi:solute:Na+ symporter, SSS family
MHWIDWLVLGTTILLISFYGIWKTRGIKEDHHYLMSSRNTPWWAVGLSIMATQASAITFISTPGMGYESGLRFVQFYFGLPLAMVIIATAFVPVYHRLKVFTAFEFLEERFDLNTRLLTAFLFLVQRGLAAGLTIYAPSIILSKLLGLPLYVNILVIGLLVIIYTVSGGTEAVTQTHKQQMAVIFVGLVIAFGFLLKGILPHLGWSDMMAFADAHGRLDAIDTKFDLGTRYNLWSGLIAGTFLMLSYFGTDQSQVQRYLSGRSVKEIRTGLYFNAVLKIPMQLFILFLGVLVFVFYQFHQPPAHFDQVALKYVEQSQYKDELKDIEQQQTLLFEEKNQEIKKDFKGYLDHKDDFIQKELKLHNQVGEIIEKSGYESQVKKESDYVFITFILDHLPIGLIGLLMAVIFSAAMSSTSAELNALGTTTVVDFHKRLIGIGSITISRAYTALWGVLAIIFALVAQFMDNLVEAVNILGSLFYGTVLGIFLVAFYVKRIGGKSVIIAAIISEAVVLSLFFFDKEIIESLGFNVEYLWYNVIGCLLVIIIGMIAELIRAIYSKS